MPTLTPGSIKTRRRVPEHLHQRGIIDTSVVIDLETIDAGDLPLDLAISALTLAELTAGPLATTDSAERARRQDRLQRVEATFDPLPFDTSAARAYGQIYAAVIESGRKARGPRAVDLLIAATALSTGLPLYSCNAGDFAQLGDLEVVAVVPRR